MPEHLSPEDLVRFMAGDLSREKRHRSVRHLLQGCPVCSPALAALEDSAPAESVSAYDLPVSRVIAEASKTVARHEAVAMLTSLLSGERTWNELATCELATLRGLPRIRALIEAGRSMRLHDVHTTLRFARLARYAADRLNPKELGTGAVADLRALAWAELANAYRICDDLPRASRAMNRSVYWSRRSSHSNVLLARVADLLASLLSAQRRFTEAIEILGLVYKAHFDEGRHHLAGRALISMGQYTASGGDAGKAILLLRQGLDLVDPTRDPVLVTQAIQSMLWCLVDLGRFRTARRLLWLSRLVLEQNRNALFSLRLRWLEGRIYAGLSDFVRAEAALQETRTGFAQREQVYPAALAGLDLAAVWVRQGRFAEVQLLAQEMIATFRALRIAREAIVTLVILQRACLSGGGQLLEIIEMVVTFLKDLERQPAKRS